jgi:hypothetical protein
VPRKQLFIWVSSLDYIRAFKKGQEDETCFDEKNIKKP